MCRLCPHFAHTGELCRRCDCNGRTKPVLGPEVYTAEESGWGAPPRMDCINGRDLPHDPKLWIL